MWRLDFRLASGEWMVGRYHDDEAEALRDLYFEEANPDSGPEDVRLIKVLDGRRISLGDRLKE